LNVIKAGILLESKTAQAVWDCTKAGLHLSLGLGRLRASLACVDT